MDARKMMQALAVTFCTVAAVSMTVDAATDTLSFNHVTGLSERLYIKWRNYNTTTGNRCHSAQKDGGSGEHFYYTLRVQLENQTFLIPINTSLTILSDNTARYSFGPDFPEVVRKLIHVSSDNECFLLSEELPDGKTGCQLVQKASSIDDGIPEDCKNAYTQNCGNEKIELYQNQCKELPDFRGQ